MNIPFLLLPTATEIYTLVFTQMSMCVCVYVCACVCIYVYVHMSVCVCVCVLLSPSVCPVFA